MQRYKADGFFVKSFNPVHSPSAEKKESITWRVFFEQILNNLMQAVNWFAHICSATDYVNFVKEISFNIIFTLQDPAFWQEEQV